MIKRVLVANRGEIALRVMRTCREMGIVSIAVYSDADRNSMHVRFADIAHYIGPSPSNESYLVIDKIIEAAKKSRADAIHPGYGFLSENAEFSERCRKEGIIFIGPSAHSISMMGDKITARKTMMKASVPVVPGTTEPITDENEAIKVIKKIGLPVMIKASAGGGGKGMRLVDKEENILSAIRGARSEAKSAFGNDAVYIEKYISSPHHIEFQVLADTHGNVIHLFERECSVQRRHQKVIEETPSPLMTPEVRDEMGRRGRRRPAAAGPPPPRRSARSGRGATGRRAGDERLCRKHRLQRRRHRNRHHLAQGRAGASVLGRGRLPRRGDTHGCLRAGGP